ncbi:TPA: hypothetical protein N0F65_011814 [Lagenidium giganteum]|uniref:Uncharacterized protein n=1 Tax=Lagenidium giganteum TaxID=4803 RepID=A0AAV2YNN9_9STRA|nr:TPA: hypothetical protein N0F65_011814 [Lagenidium giganteum]
MWMPKTEILKGQGDPTAPCGYIDGPSAVPPVNGQSYGGTPDSNTEAYTAAIKQSQYKTLKDLVMAKVSMEPNAKAECGYTNPDGPGQDVPANVEWSHGAGEGFTPSHMGPCEVWCDEERVFQDDNCAKNFPQAPAKLPIDTGKCKGKSRLKIIWLALHQPKWQVYINCAKLNGGGAAPGPSPSPSPTNQPSSTPSNQPSSSPSPSSSPGPSSSPAPAPSPSPAPSSNSPSTPGPSKKKCASKKYRLRKLLA